MMMRGTGFLRGAAVGGVGAAIVIAASSAVAGTGINGVFNLGVSNSVDKATTLTGTSPGAQLVVTNTSATTGSQALNLTGGASTTQTLRVSNPNGGAAANFLSTGSKPPFSVNSQTKVTKLNADLLDGLDSAAFLKAGAKAADSDKLDGLDSSAFLPATAKAADSDKLDNLDSTQFVQGTGVTISHAEASAPGFSGNGYYGPGDSIAIYYDCPNSLASNGNIAFFNNTGSNLNVFYEIGGPNPGYVQITPGGAELDLPAAPAGDSVTYQIQGDIDGYGSGTIFVDSVHRAASNDCHFQAQSFYTKGQ